MNSKIIKTLIALLGFAAQTMFAAEPNWQVDGSQYEYNMTVTGVVSLSDTLVENSPEVIVAAFNEAGECLGKTEVRYYAAIEKYRVPLMVYSNTNNEVIRLKAYVPAIDSLCFLTGAFNFTSDASLGNYSEPKQWMVVTEEVAMQDDPSSSIANVMVQNALMVYPNPVEGILYIREWTANSTFLVMDLSGKVVLKIESGLSNAIDVGVLKKGYYTCVLKDKNQLMIQKILKI